MTIIIVAIVAVVLGFFLGFGYHSSEVRDIQEAHKTTCLRYEMRIQQLRNELNGLRGGNNSEREPIFGSEHGKSGTWY